MILFCLFLLLAQGVDTGDNYSGNTYVQHGENSFALLHYYRAYALNPRNLEVLHKLNETQKKLGLNPSIETPQMILPLSLPERLKLFSLFLVLPCLFLSWYIWYPPVRYKTLLKIFFTISLSFLVSAIYLYLFEKDQLVLIQASNLYQGAKTTAATVKGAPLPKGSRLELLDIEPQGLWIKVKGQEGDIGYIESMKAERILK